MNLSSGKLLKIAADYRNTGYSMRVGVEKSQFWIHHGDTEENR
jgi:hypothetical protein